MIEHAVARHAAIGMAMRPGESRAGGGQRLESEALQESRAAHIPGIGNDEAAGLVQPVKRATFIGDAGTNVGHAELLNVFVVGHCARDRGSAHLRLPHTLIGY